MTKRQLSPTDEGELNTPEFDDEDFDVPHNPLPAPSTLAICKRITLAEAKEKCLAGLHPSQGSSSSINEEKEDSANAASSAIELEDGECMDAVEDETLSESDIYDMIEGKTGPGKDSQLDPNTSSAPKRRQFAIVGDKLISGPDFNVTKYVMEEFPDPSVLPTDWVKINHESGIPVYFHKRTRVATLSKPFCVGKYPVRLRHIPLSSIPCLKQQRDHAAIKNAAEKNEAVSFDHRNLTHVEVREYCSKLFKINQLSIGRWTSWKSRRQYEKLLHRVNNDANNPELSNVKIIGTGVARTPAPSEPPVTEIPQNEEADVEEENVDQDDEYDKDNGNVEDAEQAKSNNEQPNESGLIARGSAMYIRIPQLASKSTDQKDSGSANAGQSGGAKGRKQYLRVDGKPANAVLNEFTVLSTGDYPLYEDVQLPSCERSGEFCCVVKIGGIIYGIGRGRNKKLAKLEAAQEALRALIPGWRQTNAANKPGASATTGSNTPAQDKVTSGGDSERDPMLQSVSVFDSVPVDNPNITEMCQQLGLPTPYKILQTCLLRNFGMGDTELNCTVEQLSAEEVSKQSANKGGQHQHHQYRLDKVVRLSVGDRSAEVRAVSAKQGKHLAAQALLKQMHPHINNWASILRLYLRGPDVNLTATAALQRDTAVHEMAVQKRSSSEILSKLRDEMRKLASQLEQNQRDGLDTCPNSGMRLTSFASSSSANS